MNGSNTSNSNPIHYHEQESSSTLTAGLIPAGVPSSSSSTTNRSNLTSRSFLPTLFLLLLICILLFLLISSHSLHNQFPSRSNSPVRTATTVKSTSVSQPRNQLAALNSEEEEEIDISADIINNHDLSPSLSLSNNLNELKERVEYLKQQTKYPLVGMVRKAVVTMITVEPIYCRAALVLYRSIRRVDKYNEYPLIIMYVDRYDLNGLNHGTQRSYKDAKSKPEYQYKYQDQNYFMNMMTSDKYCGTLYKLSQSNDNANSSSVNSNTPMISFRPIPEILLPDWMDIMLASWRYSMQRLEMFRFEEYDRLIWMDVDVLAVRSLDSLIDASLPYHVAGVPDQSDSCERREVINGGMLAFKPSFYLYQALMQVFNHNPSCLSGNMKWTDQELLNCVCGTAGAAKAQAPDIKCGIIPIYYSTSSYRLCRNHRDEDVITLHYAGQEKKPWLYEFPHGKHCRDLAVESLSTQTPEYFSSVAECYSSEVSFFMYWYCLDQYGSTQLNYSHDNLCTFKSVQLDWNKRKTYQVIKGQTIEMDYLPKYK